MLWITDFKQDRISRRNTSPLRGPVSNNNIAPMNSFWRSCLGRFEKELPPQQYRTWIKPLRPEAEADRLTLIAPNRFVLQWIRDKFLARIQEMAREHFKRDVEVQLALADKESPPPRAAPVAPGVREREVRPSGREISRLNPAFTFETFVTGKANELARAAATQVA